MNSSDRIISLFNKFCESATKNFESLYEDKQIAFFGAGHTGRLVNKALSKTIHDRIFIDDTPALQGTFVDNTPVMDPDTAFRKYGENLVVFVCIFSQNHCFSHTRERLEKQFNWNVYTFAKALLTYGEDNIDFPYYFSYPKQVISDQKKYEKLYASLEDTYSKEVLLHYLDSKLNGNMEYKVKDPRSMDFITLNHLGGLVYIDGGAFDGDTIEAFLEQNIAFDQIYALEPDVTNFKKLEKKISALPKQIAQKITCLNKALWKEEGVVSFNQTGNVASMISDHGSNKADTITIDHILKKKNTIIKLDIEGAEISVLKSSLPILEKLTPILAISVYHNPNDLLDIFDLLVAIDCDYKFFLRCHGYDGMDLVLYAVPLTFVSEVKSYEN